MGLLRENETVFVAYGMSLRSRIVLEARVTSITFEGGDFYYRTLDLGERTGTRRLADEGVTWCRPEHVDLLRVVVALS